MPEKDLHRSQISCLFVNQGGLSSPQRMCTIVFTTLTDAGDPLIYKSSILTGAEMIRSINTTRECEFVQSAAASFEPR